VTGVQTCALPIYSFTLAIAATVAASGFALSMNLLRYLVPLDDSLRHWSTSSLLTVLGMLLQSQRGEWPDELTWVVADLPPVDVPIKSGSPGSRLLDGYLG
jgi:hypothetical protein